MKSIIYNIGILILTAAALLSSTDIYAGNDDIRFKTIVIDAGHGGKDPGSISKNGKVYEKTITLAVATRLGDKIKAGCPDVKVVYTRSSDVYKTLDERAQKANSNKANLFLSIHVNAIDASSAHGYSSHILGQSSKKGKDTFAGNLNVCKRENSVILLEDDYSTKYQGFDPTDPESFIFFNLMQNAYYEQSLNFAAEVNEQMKKSGAISTCRGISQDPFYVLWKTTMPAMLFEMGFISNPSDLAVITTDEGQDKIAEALYQAFLKFKDDYNKSLNYDEVKDSVINDSDTPVKEENNSIASSVPAVTYGIQVSTSSRKLEPGDPFFKKHPVTRIPVGNLYRYILCESRDIDKVVENFTLVSKEFPGSFLVKIEGGNVARYTSNAR